MYTWKLKGYTMIEVVYMSTEAKRRGNAKYLTEKVEDIKIRVPKGKREEYKQQAADKGYSLNAYIIKLLEDDKEK